MAEELFLRLAGPKDHITLEDIVHLVEDTSEEDDPRGTAEAVFAQLTASKEPLAAIEEQDEPISDDEESSNSTSTGRQPSAGTDVSAAAVAENVITRQQFFRVLQSNESLLRALDSLQKPEPNSPAPRERRRSASITLMSHCVDEPALLRDALMDLDRAYQQCLHDRENLQKRLDMQTQLHNEELEHLHDRCSELERLNQQQREELRTLRAQVDEAKHDDNADIFPSVPASPAKQPNNERTQSTAALVRETKLLHEIEDLTRKVEELTERNDTNQHKLKEAKRERDETVAGLEATVRTLQSSFEALEVEAHEMRAELAHREQLEQTCQDLRDQVDELHAQLRDRENGLRPSGVSSSSVSEAAPLSQTLAHDKLELDYQDAKREWRKDKTKLMFSLAISRLRVKSLNQEVQAQARQVASLKNERDDLQLQADVLGKSLGQMKTFLDADARLVSRTPSNPNTPVKRNSLHL